MTKFISYKNTTISFSDSGKGAAVILLHGFLENETMWNPFVSELSKRNRIITIDLLGHGKSDCLGYIHTMELFAETINAVLKHLRIRKSIIIGHSLGGYVALAFAEMYPKKTKGLCLINSTSNHDSVERKKIRKRANKMVQNNFTNVVRMSFVNLFSKKSKSLFKNEIEQALKQALKTPLQGYIAAQEGMLVRPNRNNILLKNNFKKLLIISEKDPVLDFKNSIEEAKKTNTDFVALQNGHMSYIENKKALLLALTKFLASFKKK